ncbi:hypothetical protein [Acidovorax sp. PRC11]|uniref:hypothetical protein n=1 Tax=Acidovorax sp. PRC11 TaxID=2962592 RepID=UPI0028817BD4|nr:hypothetical protein [Acidovorax sp. PRC11]MDT0140171.1 hypothetical protein [Acidovorax sp. PRC11]
MSADTTPGLEAERAAFEAWALSEGWTPSKLDRGRCTTYAWAALNDAWEVWQAARRAPAPAQGPTDARVVLQQLVDALQREMWAWSGATDNPGASPEHTRLAHAAGTELLARWGAPAASGETVARKPQKEEP